jgi:hypothetical protein
VPGVRVQLMQRIYFAGSQAEKHMALPVSETDSDDLGEYRFYGVKPGRYVVLAGNGISEEFILSGNWVISGIPDTFFPGTYELEEADVIAVLPGAAVEDINFTLPSSQRYSIRGRLKDLATGQPPETILLNLGTHFGDDSVQVGPPRRLKYDAASGEFEIAGLLPGKYDVEEDNLGLLWYGIRVVDRDVDLSSIAVSAYPSFRVAQAQPSLRITGRITVEGTLPAGKSIDGIRVQVGKHSFNVSKDGTFQATVPTGEHGVRVSPQPESGSMEAPLAGLYLKRVLFNGVGSRDRALFQADGAMEIVLSANGGKVDGVLRNDEGVIAGIKVVLVPADRERFDLFKTAVTDERGHYSIADIPPGSYRLFAWDSLEPNSYFDPDVLKSDEEVGKGIEIRELSRATVDLRLIPFRANR